MKNAATTFIVIAILTGLLAALSFALRFKGYQFGSLGIARLDDIADATTFIPIGALYAFGAMLIMILPVRAAGFVYANVASPVWFTALVLLASILGLQAARFGFGDKTALWALVDWKFAFAAAVIGTQLCLDDLRRGVLLKTVSFVAFLAATLACLYWTFRF